MACQTCGHTVHKVGVMPEPYTGVPLFWCPRCGTLKANVITEQHEPPKLVERVIKFAGNLTDEDNDLIHEFERLGIRESIMVDDASST